MLTMAIFKFRMVPVDVSLTYEGVLGLQFPKYGFLYGI